MFNKYFSMAQKTFAFGSRAVEMEKQGIKSVRVWNTLKDPGLILLRVWILLRKTRKDYMQSRVRMILLFYISTISIQIKTFSLEI